MHAMRLGRPLLGTIRNFSKLERVFLLSGLFLASIYIGNRVYSSLYAKAQLQRIWADQPPAPRPIELRQPSHNLLPDVRLWSDKRIKAYRASLFANIPPPLGVLQISRLPLQVPVLEGTDDLIELYYVHGELRYVVMPMS